MGLCLHEDCLYARLVASGSEIGLTADVEKKVFVLFSTSGFILIQDNIV